MLWRPASVNLPMRRTSFLALLAALFLLVPSVAHAQGTEDILRDCADDGILEGDYSASKMRDARNNIPAELEEYSDCRDVLSREISSKTSASSNNGGDTSGGGGKPATLETGAVVRVPLFVNQDEIIKVDTRSGEYSARAGK